MVSKLWRSASSFLVVLILLSNQMARSQGINALSRRIYHRPAKRCCARCEGGSGVKGHRSKFDIYLRSKWQLFIRRRRSRNLPITSDGGRVCHLRAG